MENLVLEVFTMDHIRRMSILYFNSQNMIDMNINIQ